MFFAGRIDRPSVCCCSSVTDREHQSKRERTGVARAAQRDERETVQRWYGWQTLAVDAAVPVLILGAIGIDTVDQRLSPYVGVAAGSTYVFGAPIVHWAHGHRVRAVGSLGMRVALPIVAGLVTWASFKHDPDCDSNYVSEREDCSSDGLRQFGEVLIAGTIGAVVASAIDASVLSYDSYERPRSAPTATITPDAGWSPNTGWTIGAHGTF